MNRFQLGLLYCASAIICSMLFYSHNCKIAEQNANRRIHVPLTPSAEASNTFIEPRFMRPMFVRVESHNTTESDSIVWQTGDILLWSCILASIGEGVTVPLLLYAIFLIGQAFFVGTVQYTLALRHD